jgi:gluconolactonase
MLYYVDIPTGRVFSYNYNTTEINYITLNGQVSPVITSKKNENLFIVGLNRSIVAVEWDGKNQQKGQKVLTTVSQQFPTSTINDGKADKEGRLWFGTIGEQINGEVISNNGVFYKIIKENISNPIVEISPVNISNGLAWNQANNKMYYIDTPTLAVVEYDFDDLNGDISNPRVAVDIANYTFLTGRPDGMTIDKDENLWIALYGGGAIIKANPKTGELLQVIGLPARDVTSAIWGGPDLDILFVTTARVSLTAEERKLYPSAGSVFAITNLKTSGLAVFNADIIDSI